ncbi:MAG: hypothetical protein DRZ79_00280 [Candidatus Cloacimonadota bacterium]|nr:MAG: hypothetical protein DRZ79_00280 [Candidatus Cloacimonadota bacterium]
MNKKIFSEKLIVFLIFVFILAGCTKKKNTVGIPNENIQPQEIVLNSTFIEDCFSFEDSCRNYNENTNLIFGSFHGTQTYSLLRFANFPDSVVSFSGNANLKLYLKDKVNSENIALQMGKIEENWLEDKATWFTATDSTDWTSPGDFFSEIIPEEWNITEDTLSISFSCELIEDWINSDSTNFGLVLFSSADSSFLEINSSETDKAPLLTFDYFTVQEDTMKTYSAAPVSDTFIFSSDNDYAKFENRIIISDIQPIKTFIKFNISDSVFMNYENSGIENNDDFRRMTINRAELIFHKTEEDFYLSGDELILRPYPVLSENPDIPFVYGEDYEYLMGSSSDSLNTDEFVVDVTAIVQKITSGDYENHGFLLKSIFENKDYSYVEFASKNYQEEALRPFLRIIYTPPFLDERE